MHWLSDLANNSWYIFAFGIITGGTIMLYIDINSLNRRPRKREIDAESLAVEAENLSRQIFELVWQAAADEIVPATLDRERLDGLLRRLETATGPFMAQGITDLGWDLVKLTRDPKSGNVFWNRSDPIQSVDAAGALIAIVLPKWEWGIETHAFNRADAWLRKPDTSACFERYEAETPALALCLALCQALKNRVEAGAGERVTPAPDRATLPTAASP